MTVIAYSRAEFEMWRATVDEVAVVLTMGALHDGHASLMDLAKGTGLPVVVTVFVNPTQFAAHEDLDRYPRTADDDIKVAEAHGVDCIWLPDIEDVYPSDEAASASELDPGSLGSVLEGAIRPTHFAGVLMVVNRFFSIIRPSIAVFGKKDRQQLVVIDRAFAGSGVQILAGDTVREADGLALSSRNRFLTQSDRESAGAIPRALRAGADAADSGASVAQITERAKQELDGLELDYCVVTDAYLSPVDAAFHGSAILLVAARVGTTRLIDNIDLVIR